MYFKDVLKIFQMSDLSQLADHLRVIRLVGALGGSEIRIFPDLAQDLVRQRDPLFGIGIVLGLEWKDIVRWMNDEKIKALRSTDGDGINSFDGLMAVNDAAVNDVKINVIWQPWRKKTLIDGFDS